MDDWDAVASGPKLLSDNVPRCDLTPREALHRIGSLYYISQFKRSKEGMTFLEIKSSADHAAMFADVAAKFISAFIGNTEDWCIITTPRRRHADGFHFATEVCRLISASVGIPFYDDALQCINHDRLHIAAMAMQGVVANGCISSPDEIAKYSFAVADALIAAVKEGGTDD